MLEARNLALALGAFRLGPVSLRVERDDYLILLGPSGCGKTSLLRAMAGAYAVMPGQLFCDGRDLSGVTPEDRRISYVSQSADLFPHLTVAQNIGFGLSYRGVPRSERRDRVEAMARRFGVDALLRRHTPLLSGGEAKRVALARGLIVGPLALLLDEPLAGVDPYAREGMFDALRMIHDELHTATIHVTHDRDEARAMGTRCAVMRDGRTEQEDDIEALFARPATPFVARFLGLGAARRPASPGGAP